MDIHEKCEKARGKKKQNEKKTRWKEEVYMVNGGRGQKVDGSLLVGWRERKSEGGDKGKQKGMKKKMREVRKLEKKNDKKARWKEDV